MTTDNRGEIHDCDAVSTWTGTSAPSLVTDIKYEGTGSLAVQATNAAREWYYVIASGSQASRTLYFLVKATNPTTKAAGGIQLILGDGTNRRGYYVGGNDDPGLPLPGGWACYRLDTDALPASYLQILGAGAPNLAAITQIGVGILNAAKAVGSSNNTYFDRISYIANGSKAFTITAGTSGTPITFANLVADDITNGWGFFNNPIAGSKQYCVYGAVAWGDSTAASYFGDSDAQVYFLGAGQSAGSMNQAVLGHNGTIQSLALTSCVLVNISTVCNWEFSIANHEILKFTACTFKGFGTFSFPTTDNTNKYVVNSTFDTCGRITLRTLLFTGNTVKNCAGTTGALLVPSTGHQLATNTFSGNVYALEFDTNGTYSLNGDQFSTNSGADVFYSYTGANNLIIACGGTPKANPSTNHNHSTGTVTINNSNTFTVTVRDSANTLISGARVKLIAAEDNTEFPYQDAVGIARVNQTATVTLNAHGLQTNEYVEITGATQIEYNGVFQITQLTANTFSYTVSGTPATPATGSPICTFVLLSGTTTAGVLTSSTVRYIANDLDFTGVVRKTSASTYYKQGIISGTMTNANYSTTVFLSTDE